MVLLITLKNFLATLNKSARLAYQERSRRLTSLFFLQSLATRQQKRRNTYSSRTFVLGVFFFFKYISAININVRSMSDTLVQNYGIDNKGKATGLRVKEQGSRFGSAIDLGDCVNLS